MKFIYHQVTITITNPISWVKGKLHELHFRWTYHQSVNHGIFRSERHHGVSNIQVHVGHCFGWPISSSGLLFYSYPQDGASIVQFSVVCQPWRLMELRSRGLCSSNSSRALLFYSCAQDGASMVQLSVVCQLWRLMELSRGLCESFFFLSFEFERGEREIYKEFILWSYYGRSRNSYSSYF